MSEHPHGNKQLLGDYEIPQQLFPSLDKVFKQFDEEEFHTLSTRKRFKKVNQVLLKLIQEAPEESFLLPAVVNYIDRINQTKILNEPYLFSSFEFWLNQFSGLNDHDNYLIRGKVVGKSIPRGEYQAFFPIGMGRVFPGSHFVAAHLSPDVDTTVASFWGWMDALAARIGTGLHQWSLPGGPPESTVMKIFREMFGQTAFASLARQAGTVTLSAMDMVSQQNFLKQHGNTLVRSIIHSSNEHALVLIDEEGHYLGDWRASDVELIIPILFVVRACLRWFENNLHTKLISLFAKPDLTTADIPDFLKAGFQTRLADCEPLTDLSEKQKEELNVFFSHVINMPKSLEGTFSDLNIALSLRGVPDLLNLQKTIEATSESGLFDTKGRLEENRPKIFHYLEKVIHQLDEAIQTVRNFLDRLEIAMDIKYKVLKHPLLYITLRSDVDEMRVKMKNYDYLTVVIPNHDGALFPLGVVRATDLRKSILGTVSLRDFCNQEEIKMASYLEVISVVDHHKSSLRTSSTPMVLISDTQSCNILLAEQALQLNERYTLSGMTSHDVEAQIRQLLPQTTTKSNIRIMQKLLQKRITAQSADSYYIHPAREFSEFLCYLHAILDDTDLLTKVSDRDVECIANLLNKLKSIASKQEMEIINLDNIPRDKNFAKTASKRILQHPDMYSLYKKVYMYKEQEVDANLKNCVDGFPSNIFVDTKEQNGCSRIGQTKMFSSNFILFFQHADELRHLWFHQASDVNQNHLEIDLHLHMTSTIASAEEVYSDSAIHYDHEDEIWFWVPSTQTAHDHLSSFLSSFQTALDMMKTKLDKDKMSLEFLGPNAVELAQTFSQNLSPIKMSTAENHEKGLPIAVLRFSAGALNSRKSMITPFIPRLVP
jgi:hypothetical protein